MSIPEVFFRETIDLNRYSNAVANKFVENYIQVIYDATKQLVALDKRQKKAALKCEEWAALFIAKRVNF